MDKALKQRLVGASVLIALAVIVLPMLLSGRPQNSTQQSQKIELPPRPGELSFETRRFPITQAQSGNRPKPDNKITPINRLPPAPQAGADATGDETEPPVDSLTKPSLPIDEPVVAPNVDSSESIPVNVAQTQPVTGRYVVQVASLGSAENASRLMASLEEKRLPVLLDVINSEVGQLNRVRVGPYESESEASQVSVTITNEIKGVSPRVMDLRPDQADSPTQIADTLMRWIVQVGSFAESSNAEALVKQLRSDGMSAYSETVTSSSSSIFRVRIGPFLERDIAIRTKQKLSEDLSIDGVVMSAE